MIELFVIVKGIDGGCNGSNGPGASTAKRGKKVTTAEANPTDTTTKLTIAEMAFQCRFHHGDFCCAGGAWGDAGFEKKRPLVSAAPAARETTGLIANGTWGDAGFGGVGGDAGFGFLRPFDLGIATF
jgi:hypothetical protein